MSSPLTLENSLILACVRTEPDVQRIHGRDQGRYDFLAAFAEDLLRAHVRAVEAEFDERFGHQTSFFRM